MRCMRRTILILTAVLALAVAAVSAPAHKGGHHHKFNVTGGETTLTLSPDAVGALGTLGISLEVIEPGAAGLTGVSFPITKSTLRTNLRSGSVIHKGGLALVRDATRVELTQFIINVDSTPALSAIVAGGDRVEIADLDLSEAGIYQTPEALVFTRVAVALSEAAASALNAAFATDAFAAGLPLGVATVEAELNGGGDD